MHEQGCVKIYYSRSRDSVSGDCGQFYVEFPYALLKDAYRAHRGIGAEESFDEELGGFFSFVKKALHKAAAIANNPLVRAVVGVVPGGGTALSAVTIADQAERALESGINAITKKPTVHKLISAARKGDTRAAHALRSLPSTAKKAAQRAEVLQKHTVALAKDMKEVRGLLHKAGYTPDLVKALSHAPAPWGG